MTEVDDGGHAFAMGYEYESSREHGRIVYEQQGMSLRDWLAGQAMSGILAHPQNHYVKNGELARDCYDWADQMIAEKRRTEG